MSARLFMYKAEELDLMSTEDLTEKLTFWKDVIANPKPHNKFEADRAAGYRHNIAVAEALLYAHSRSIYKVCDKLDREGWGCNPDMIRAYVDMVYSGTGYLKLTGNLMVHVTQAEFHQGLNNG